MFKISMSLLITFLSSVVIAKTVELPRGGKLNFDHKEWSVLETKVTPSLKSLLLIHNKEKGLKGFLLDGTIKNQGVCKAPAVRDWSTCETSQKVGKEIQHQIFIQRALSKDSIQSYVISFNYDAAKENTYKNLINDMKKSLESK
jgi:hypothetical protein